MSKKGFIPSHLFERYRILKKYFGERKPATVLFLKIFPENYNLLKETILFIDEISHKYNGEIDKTLNGLFLITFGTSKSIESHTLLSVYFAEEIKNFLKTKKINFKMGIHTGNLVFVVMGSKKRKEFTVMGDTVNTASRVMSIAKQGEVLVTKELYTRCKDEFEFSTAGKVKVKGKKRKIEVYKLEGKKLSAVKTKFINREKELAQFFRIIDRVYKTGENIKINLRGESKTGKTSLIIEAHKRYGNNFVLLRLQSFPYFNRIPLMPLISFIKYLSRNYKRANEFLKTKKIKSIDAHSVPLILPSLVELLSPCIFLVENLELFDSASRKIIENLNFKKHRGIIFIIETDKLKLKGFREIKLKAFDFEKLHDFLSVYLQKKVDSLLSSFIFEKTKGVPGFAISITENLLKRKEILLKKGILSLKNPEKPPPVPDNILSFQLSILDEFDARKRDFLEKLAVAGFPLKKSEFCKIFGKKNAEYFDYFEKQGILKSLDDERSYFQDFYFEKAIYEHILKKEKRNYI